MTTNASGVITALTGASTGTSPVATRERRSRSVTIPSAPSGSVTTTAVVPASPISRAASRIAVSGSQTTGARRTSVPTGRAVGPAPPAVPSSAVAAPDTGRSSSVRATNRTPAGCVSTGAIAAAGTR